MVSSYARVRRPSKQTVFVMLMAASLGLMLLPWDVLGRARQATGVLAPLQLLATRAGHGTTDPFKDLGATAISPQEHAVLVSQLDAMRNLSASLAMEVTELQAKVADLTHIRSQPGFPEHGRLVPAKVIGADAVASRGSLVLDSGRLNKVKAGAWVTTKLYADAGTEDGAGKGAGVLVRETLIGWIDETDPFTSRVILLSDNLTGHPILVRIGRQNPTTGRTAVFSLDGKPAKFALQGAGRGLMKIREVDARYVEGGFVKAGDIVTSDPNDFRLPVPMVIGEITTLEKVKASNKKPLYYTAHVKHRYDPQLVSQVFIADFSREPQRSSPERGARRSGS